MDAAGPPRVQLNISSSFKRSFEELGIDLDSPSSSSTEGNLNPFDRTNDRNKRARSSSAVFDSLLAEGSSSSSSTSSGPPRLPTPRIDHRGLEELSAPLQTPGSVQEVTIDAGAAERERRERFLVFDSEMQHLRSSPVTLVSPAPPVLPPLTITSLTDSTQTNAPSPHIPITSPGSPFQPSTLDVLWLADDDLANSRPPALQLSSVAAPSSLFYAPSSDQTQPHLPHDTTRQSQPEPSSSRDPYPFSPRLSVHIDHGFADDLFQTADNRPVMPRTNQSPRIPSPAIDVSFRSFEDFLFMGLDSNSTSGRAEQAPRWGTNTQNSAPLRTSHRHASRVERLTRAASNSLISENQMERRRRHDQADVLETSSSHPTWPPRLSLGFESRSSLSSSSSIRTRRSVESDMPFLPPLQSVLPLTPYDADVEMMVDRPSDHLEHPTSHGDRMRMAYEGLHPPAQRYSSSSAVPQLLPYPDVGHHFAPTFSRLSDAPMEPGHIWNEHVEGTSHLYRRPSRTMPDRLSRRNERSAMEPHQSTSTPEGLLASLDRFAELSSSMHLRISRIESMLARESHVASHSTRHSRGPPSLPPLAFQSAPEMERPNDWNDWRPEPTLYSTRYHDEGRPSVNTLPPTDFRPRIRRYTQRRQSHDMPPLAELAHPHHHYHSGQNPQLDQARLPVELPATRRVRMPRGEYLRGTESIHQEAMSTIEHAANGIRQAYEVVRRDGLRQSMRAPPATNSIYEPLIPPHPTRVAPEARAHPLESSSSSRRPISRSRTRATSSAESAPTRPRYNRPHWTNAPRTMGDYIDDEDFDPSYESLISLSTALGDARPRGTPNDVIASLSSSTYQQWAVEGSDKRCAICLEDYQPADPVLKLSQCDHWLHKDCLEQWLHASNTCPICRTSVGSSRSGRSGPTHSEIPSISILPLPGGPIGLPPLPRRSAAHAPRARAEVLQFDSPEMLRRGFEQWFVEDI